MQFNISKSSFNSALNLVSRAIAVNSPLPALSGIKLELSEDELTLTGSDADLSIKKMIPANEESNSLDIKEPGSIVLEARYLLDIVRKMDSDIIHFEIVDGTLVKISGNAVQFNLNGTRASSYPAIDFSTPEMQFSIKADELGTIINQTLFATSDKETRPVLTGINFNYNLQELMVVATDSYRLARKHVLLSSIDTPFNATIPRKVLGEITKVLDEEENMLIAIDHKKVQFINDHNVVQSSLLDGIYPETNRLIP
ncbi:MAG: DNA polymerase III subunit beta, partial [Erysipelothrix sp.]|nr:DNA polymerase III subunit beta [Erysipelothrix sp.]